MWSFFFYVDVLQTWTNLFPPQGNALPGDISCLAADRMLVFAAVGRDVYAFARNKEVRRVSYSII